MNVKRLSSGKNKILIQAARRIVVLSLVIFKAVKLCKKQH